MQQEIARFSIKYQYFDYYVTIGADISNHMVSYAKKYYADEKLSYIVLNIEAPELPSDQINRYNNVFSFYCLHWCNDLR